MAMISFHKVSFFYADPFHPVFNGLTLSFDTDWKTGLVGRNGRGKSTFLKLLAGSLQPREGALLTPAGFSPLSFPFPVPDTGQAARDIIKESIAPFSLWEEEMRRCLMKGTPEDLTRYGEVEALYSQFNGYTMDAAVLREGALLGLSEELLLRPFKTLSGGEQTKSQILALFLHPAPFPLIDEPTNHLDMDTRSCIASYLRSKKEGFLVVSHDRAFLDDAIDHIVALNREETRLYHGNYSVYHREKMRRDQMEREKNSRLKKEIRRLTESSRAKEGWSFKKEKEKIGSGDKGAVGAQAARLMKRSLIIRRRARLCQEEKEGLLKNIDTPAPLKIHVPASLPAHILTVADLSVAYGDKRVISGLSFSLRKGERLAVMGPNGSGKTSLLRAILNEVPFSGTIRLPRHVSVSRVSQFPRWHNGLLQPRLDSSSLDETAFRNVLGILGVSGEIFHRPLETFSLGELKKTELARSLVEEAGLFLWDEPLNDIDLVSREQLEEAVSAYEPTVIFIEHDKTFIERCATSVLSLNHENHVRRMP